MLIVYYKSRKSEKKQTFRQRTENTVRETIAVAVTVAETIAENVATIDCSAERTIIFSRPTCKLCNCITDYANLSYFYLRQVNEVNGGDNAFVRCVCVCRCVCLCGRSWKLNANSSKTVKATDFKFDTRVPRDSPDMIPKNFPKRGRGHGHVTP